MSTDKQLETIRRQTMQYKYEDGFVEMSLGSIFLLCSIFLMTIFSIDKSYVWFITVGAVVTVFGMAFVLNRLVKRLKENVTYPRTGYVEVNDSKTKWILWLELALAVSLIAVAWFLGDNPDPLAIFNGLVLAVTLSVLGMQHAVKRLYIIAVIALILGFGFALAGFSTDVAYTGPYAGTGLALVISGGLTLRHYLQTHAIED